MVVDTSALMAILLDEPEREIFSELLGEALSLQLSAGTLIEATSVTLGQGGPDLEARLTALVRNLNIAIAPVDQEQAGIARGALYRFGKGRHPARLNIGDTFAYALAMQRQEPLLFKGNDFAQTDVTPAV